MIISRIAEKVFRNLFTFGRSLHTIGRTTSL